MAEAAPGSQEKQTKPAASFIAPHPGSRVKSLPSSFLPENTVARGCVGVATLLHLSGPHFPGPGLGSSSLTHLEGCPGARETAATTS